MNKECNTLLMHMLAGHLQVLETVFLQWRVRIMRWNIFEGFVKRSQYSMKRLVGELALNLFSTPIASRTHSRTCTGTS